MSAPFRSVLCCFLTSSSVDEKQTPNNLCKRKRKPRRLRPAPSARWYPDYPFLFFPNPVIRPITPPILLSQPDSQVYTTAKSVSGTVGSEPTIGSRNTRPANWGPHCCPAPPPSIASLNQASAMRPERQKSDYCNRSFYDSDSDNDARRKASRSTESGSGQSIFNIPIGEAFTGVKGRKIEV